MGSSEQIHFSCQPNTGHCCWLLTLDDQSGAMMFASDNFLFDQRVDEDRATVAN